MDDAILESNFLRQALFSLLYLKMPVFGHFGVVRVYWLCTAISKLQTSASAGETSKWPPGVNTHAALFWSAACMHDSHMASELAEKWHFLTVLKTCLRMMFHL